MLRHWVLVLVALLATAPVARSIGDEVEAVYEAKGTLLLLSPAKTYSADGKVIEVNPFTRSGNAERVAAGAVLTVTNTTRWKDRMISAGATGDYEYRLVSEVVMEVTVRSDTPAGALDDLNIAIRLLEEELAQRQQRAGAPRETWIYVDTLAVPEEATILLGSRIRATAGVGILGVAVAATLAFVAEALGIGGGRRRRRRRRAKAERGRSAPEVADSPDTPNGHPEEHGTSGVSPAPLNGAKSPLPGRPPADGNGRGALADDEVPEDADATSRPGDSPNGAAATVTARSAPRSLQHPWWRRGSDGPGA